MIHAIDKRITALFQALVNWSQRKPRWWAEHCVYIVLLSMVVGVAIGPREEVPAWLQWVQAAMGLIIVTAMGIATRVQWIWDALAEDPSEIGWRAVWVIFFADDVVRLCIGDHRQVPSLLYGFAILAFSYLLTCEDPTPPKPRTRASLAGSH